MAGGPIPGNHAVYRTYAKCLCCSYESWDEMELPPTPLHPTPREIRGAKRRLREKHARTGCAKRIVVSEPACVYSGYITEPHQLREAREKRNRP